MLSNIDIENKLKHYKKFKGVYSKDLLPRKLNYGFYIINLDDSKNEGTHWVAFLRDKNINIYFDSFGSPPIDKLNIKPLMMNAEQIQNINSDMCGYYCIEFIKFLYNKENFKESFQVFIDLFKNPRYNINDIILKKLINKEIQ